MIEGSELAPEEEDKDLVSQLKSDVNKRLARRDEGLRVPESTASITSPLFDLTDVEQTKTPTGTAKVGAFENFFRNAKEHNELLQIGKGTSRIMSDLSNDYLADEIPPGWNPANEAALEQVSGEYYTYVLSARSPKEQQEHIQVAKERMQEQELLSNGGVISTLLGAIAGVVTSPPSIIVPMAVASRAGFAAHTLKAMGKIAPAVAIQSGIHEGILQFGNPGFNEHELVTNTIRDTAFGMFLYGAGRTVTFGSNKANIWKARKTMNVVDEGIGIKLKVGENGELKGLVATGMDDSVGAARVAVAQRYLDSQPVFDGVAGVVASIGGSKFLGSPLIQGLKSPFTVVADWTNQLANSSILTRGVERGLVRKETMEETLGVLTKEAIQTSIQINDLYHTSIGVKPGIAAPAKAVIKNVTEGLDTTKAAFYDKVQAVRLTGEKSTIKEVNEAADLYGNHVEAIYKRFLDAYGMPTDVAAPRTSVDYMTRMYNLNEMAQNPEKFFETVVRSLQKQDEQIIALKEPVDQLKESIKILRRELDVPLSKGGRKRGKINAEIKKSRQQLKALEKKMVDDMRDGIIDPALLEDRVWLSSAETDELKELMKPVRDIESKIDAVQADIDLLEPKQRAKTPKTKAEKLKAKAEKARRPKDAKPRNLEEQLEALKTEKAGIMDDLRRRAKDGEINERLHIKSEKTGDIEFRDASAIPKFRKLKGSVADMQREATAYYDTLLNQTPEQTHSAILSKMAGGGTDSSAARTIMIPDVDLAGSGFLVNDLDSLLTSYSRSMGRKIIMKERFAETSIDDGFKGLTADLALERTQKMNKILANEKTTEAKKKKQLLKLSKEFDEAKKLMGDSYKAFMGTHIENSRMQRNVATANRMAAIAQLKNVPLLQLTETTATVMKQGFGKVISRGMTHLIKRMNLFKKDAFFLESAGHALVGMENGLTRLGQETVDSMHIKSHPGVVNSSKFQSYVEKASRYSQTLFGTNAVMNFQQKLSADITQSRVMSELFQAANGTLSKGKAERLRLAGIDPSRAAEYIAQYTKANGFKEFGGHQSNWFLWENTELSNSMGMAIRSDIKNTILESGMLDKPFAASNNPMMQFVFQYTGYLYASFNRFAIPFAQRPDFDKMTGLLLLMSAGAMIEPMRAWQRGEDFELDSEKQIDQWLASGFIESGMGGWPIELVQRAGAIIDIPFLERYKQDKFRRRPSAGVVGGPFFSYLDSMAQLGGMAISGEINKSDLKRATGNGLIPMNLALDRLIKKSIDNSNLPETRAQAR